MESSVSLHRERDLLRGCTAAHVFGSLAVSILQSPLVSGHRIKFFVLESCLRAEQNRVLHKIMVVLDLESSRCNSNIFPHIHHSGIIGFTSENLFC